ncbi:MAG TPA: hypothetical protein VFU81_13310 [Thermomicrobiales bacterium]|nr:hypothetical protein [Thermomicrobiales bacterium]
MDGRRFDAFARRLSSDLTRRRVVGLLGGAALGVALAAGKDDASAGNKKRCPGGCGVCQRCKRGKCKPHAGAACGAGGKCLANGSCALVCKTPADCPAPCPGCSSPSAEGPSHCAQGVASCEDIPQTCSSTKQCPVGQQCQQTLCGTEDRCCPLCSP